MGIRVVCFILMVVITPYGWYTWVFGAAAIFLPYIAVVGANVGQEGRRNRREDPERSLPAVPRTPLGHASDVIRIDESHAVGDGRSPAETATDQQAPEQPAPDQPASDQPASDGRADGSA